MTHQTHERRAAWPYCWSGPCIAAWLTIAGSLAADDSLPASPGMITPDNVAELRVAASFPREVRRIEFGPGENELTLLGFLESLEIVDDQDLNSIREIDAGEPSEVAVSSDGRWMAWSDRVSGQVVVQDTENEELFGIDITAIDSSLAFSPNGDLLAIGESLTLEPVNQGAGYSFVRLCQTDGTLVRDIMVSTQGYGALTPVFSPDGTLLAVGNRNYETRLFDVETGELLHTFPKARSQELAFSPDGTLLAVAYVSGELGMLDVETGQVLDSQPTGAEETYSLAWNPTGDLLATCGHEGDIVIWDPGEMTPLVQLPAPVWVIQVRFSPDGTRLYTAGAESDTGRQNPSVDVWTVDGVLPDHLLDECGP